MFWFKTKDAPAERTALQTKQAACKHDGRFTVYGSNTAIPPHGTCNDCGAEIPLDDILNVYIKKMNVILDRNGIR